MKQPAVYIIASKKNGTIYTGVTSNLARRIYEHKNSLIKGFASKYKCKILVFFEIHDTMGPAILRESQIKGWTRAKKLLIIEKMNPGWKDLASEWGCE